jgi:hypothetical protein
LSLGTLLCVALSACGSHAATRKVAALPKPCRERAVAAVAGAVGVRAARVRVAAGTGNNGSPQCVYRAGAVSVTVNVDNGAQPYFRLERAGVELSQQFSSGHTALEVDHVLGLGLDAFWIPAEHEVITTDGTNLLTVTVSGPRAAQQRIAVAAARAHLGKLVPPPGFSG